MHLSNSVADICSNSHSPVADPGVRSNPPSYSSINKELTLLSTYDFKRLLAAVTSIEGSIKRSVTKLAAVTLQLLAETERLGNKIDHDLVHLRTDHHYTPLCTAFGSSPACKRTPLSKILDPTLFSHSPSGDAVSSQSFMASILGPCTVRSIVYRHKSTCITSLIFQVHRNDRHD